MNINRDDQKTNRLPGHQPTVTEQKKGIIIITTPDSEVYFDGGRGVYFYMDAGTWLMAPRLPSRIQININNYVSVELDGDRPYLYHKETVKKYPPGQLKKKNKGKKKKKGKEKWK